MVRLPKDLLKRARRKAAAEGRTLTSLIEEGLRLVVDRTEENKKEEAGHAACQQGCGRSGARVRLHPFFFNTRKWKISNTSGG